MKKYLSIFLLFLYTASAIGINISLHYCGEQLADVAIISQTECCCENETTEADDCCKNEKKTFKIQADQDKVSFVEKKFAHAFNLIDSKHVTYLFKSEDTLAITAFVSIPDPPDNLNLIPAYKRNHSFLFYG